MKTGWIVLIIVVALAALILPGCQSEPEPEMAIAAPDFVLGDLAGKRVALSDFRGKAVFLNFWATTCPPCREEMPAIESLYQEYRTKDVVVLGVNVGQSQAEVSQFVKAGGFSWLFLLDTNGQAAREYGISAIPASFFIDKQGIIRAAYVGGMSHSTMTSLLEKAIKGGS